MVGECFFQEGFDDVWMRLADNSPLHPAVAACSLSSGVCRYIPPKSDVLPVELYADYAGTEKEQPL